MSFNDLSLKTLCNPLLAESRMRVNKNFKNDRVVTKYSTKIRGSDKKN